MHRSAQLMLPVLTAVTLLAGAPRVFAQTPKAAPATSAGDREINLSAYASLLRSDIRSQKAALIAEVMQFSEGDDAKFWPIYREYEKDLSKLNDERIALIGEYAANYEKLTDEIADRLALRALDLETR